MNDSVQTAEQLYAALDGDDVSPFLDLCADTVVVDIAAATAAHA